MNDRKRALISTTDIVVVRRPVVLVAPRPGLLSSAETGLL